MNHQAINILEDYFRQVSQNPTCAEREALLDKLKADPNCEGYTPGRITDWFYDRRHRNRARERRRNNRTLLKEQKKQAMQHSANDNNSYFPSLTPDAIQHLTVLANSQPNPSPELLKTWAALLASSGATEHDVIKWTLHRNQEQQLQKFPTPSDSTTSMTPEPSSSTFQSPAQSAPPQEYKQKTITSLVTPALQLPFHEHAQAEPSLSPTLLSPSNKDSMPSLPSKQCSHAPGLQAIIHGVRDALANPQTTPTTVAPKTAAEFEAMFSPFEKRMSLLYRALE